MARWKYMRKPARIPTCHPERKHRAHGLCTPCYTRRWASKNTDRNRPLAYRKWELKTYYGMTVEDYDRLFKSCGGRCCLCQVETKLAVDHDHVTGRVRGLLCRKCNLALGHYEQMANNPKLKEYLCQSDN